MDTDKKDLSSIRVYPCSSVANNLLGSTEGEFIPQEALGILRSGRRPRPGSLTSRRLTNPAYSASIPG
jgi:hypothetical protein